MQLEEISYEAILVLGDIEFFTFTAEKVYEFNKYCGNTFHIWDTSCDMWNDAVCSPEYYTDYTHYIIIQE